MLNLCRSGLSRRANVAMAAASIMLIALQSNVQEARSPRGGITKIQITSTQPAFGSASFGRVGPYEILSGKAYGTIDPRTPANAGLTYLNYAPLNTDGLIDYNMDFAILRPVNAAAGNGRSGV
jgi:hypothetical protein